MWNYISQLQKMILEAKKVAQRHHVEMYTSFGHVILINFIDFVDLIDYIDDIDHVDLIDHIDVCDLYYQ